MGFMITIPAGERGSFNAYVAAPANGTGPGLVIIQEIFGVNSTMRALADHYAEAGYWAIVPDLFWRQEPNVVIEGTSETELAQAYALYQNFDEIAGIQDLQATLAALKVLPGCTGQVGSVGFCLGGKLAYLMATRTDSRCNISYYGVGIERNLDEASHIQNPLLLHLAGADQLVPPVVQNLIKAKLKDCAGVTIYDYPKVEHAFARIGGGSPPYDEASATLADSRTLAFLGKYLT